MLWDAIRDFFVQYIFGGYDSNGNQFICYIGNLFSSDEGLIGSCATFDTYLPMNGYTDVTGSMFDYISLGDWLSTTATIISITLIVLACALFVCKIIKLIGGLIR